MYELLSLPAEEFPNLDGDMVILFVVFCVWQGIMVLIPSFLMMAFAKNIFLMYTGLALFSFGKQKQMNK